MRSYGLDALESAAPPASNEVDADTVRAFLDDIASADVTRFKALGLGEDLRLKGRDFTGGALELSSHIVHLVSFRDGLHETH
jgi:ARG and Rhodanese-Phosphatase-superfamily-associated Protein domain